MSALQTHLFRCMCAGSRRWFATTMPALALVVVTHVVHAQPRPALPAQAPSGHAAASQAQPVQAHPVQTKPVQATPPQTPLAAPALGASATRADLARAYISFEEAFLNATADGTMMDEAELVLMQRRFDSATVQFFTGQSDQAMRELHALSRRLANLALPDKDAGNPQATDDRVLRLLSDALRTKLDAPVLTIEDIANAATRPIMASIRSLYVLGAPTDKENKAISAEERWVFDVATKHTLTLGIAALDDPEALWTQSITVSHEPGSSVMRTFELIGLDAALDALVTDEDKPRTLRFGWIDPQTNLLIRESSRLTIGPSLLSVVRARIDERLDKLLPPDEVAIADPAALKLIAVSRAIARERASALTDMPSEVNSTEFLQDLGALATSLEAEELPALEAGENPYDHKEGEFVMPLILTSATGQQAVACRVYAPPQATARSPVPVVIAFHGAGGDEAMWLHAYGAGMLKELADRHGFLVVSPSTFSFAMKPALVDALLEQLRSCYTIDDARICIMGHSLGAQAAVSIAWSRPRVFAGCVLFAGGRPPLRVSLAGVPTLVVLGGQDPIAPADRLSQAWTAAQEKPGADIQVRTVEEAGHTLLVTTELDRCIEWLMTRTLKP